MATSTLTTRTHRVAGALILAAGAWSSLSGQAVLSSFEGSTDLGRYEAEFDQLAYVRSLERGTTVETVGGVLLSRVFEKPAGRSNPEVFRSYERELTAAGFTIHFASALTSPMSFELKKVYDPPHTAFSQRVYQKPGGGRVGALDLSFIVGLADHYLLASRTAGGEERWVAVLLSGSRPYYMVEELTLAAMEEGTVTLDLEAMRSEIESSGKIAIYDIHFATGSAELQPTSADALAVVATYLREAPGAYYIVGHTDDTGSLDHNMRLSDARAAAVKQALVDTHGIDPSRLETRGVGPLVPVSANTDESGRALNRRVEIVQRLP